MTTVESLGRTQRQCMGATSTEWYVTSSASSNSMNAGSALRCYRRRLVHVVDSASLRLRMDLSVNHGHHGLLTLPAFGKLGRARVGGRFQESVR